MQAVILAGGKGTRLRPITDLIPKPLVSLNNRPIIEWQIAYLQRAGVTDCIISSGYKSGLIESYLNRKTYHKIDLRYSVEEEPLGTGGAIRKAAPMITEDSFYVINGDVITDMDLRRLITPNCIAAINLRTNFGVLETDGSQIRSFAEKRPLPDIWMNAGVYHLSSSILDDLPVQGNIEKTTFPRYAKEGRLFLERFDDTFWHSIDSYKDIEECSRNMLEHPWYSEIHIH